MNSSRVLYALALLFFLAVTPSSAEAKGLLIINTGDEIFDAAELPEALQSPEVDGWRLGWMCSRFGVLWADVWTWDCRLVAYQGDNYSDLPPDLQAQLEEAHPKSSANRGLWNRFGIFALLGVVAVLGIAGARGDDESTPSAPSAPESGSGGDDPPPMPK